MPRRTRARLRLERLDDRINPTPAVTRLSADTFFIDKDPTPALTSAYVGYQVQGDGVVHTDVYAKIGSFSAGIGLSAGAPDTVRLGDLSAAGKLNAYFYLTAPESLTPKTYTVTFYSGLPSLGNVLATFNETLTAVEDTIQAAANKFTSGSVVSSGALAIGSTFDLVLHGSTGTVGNPLIAYTPASLAGWLPSAFQVVNTSLTFSSGDLTGAVVPAGALFYQPAPTATSNSDYTITYTLRAINSTTTTTSLSPITNIGSGTQVKHTDTGSWATLAPIPVVANNLTVGMTAGAATGGVSTVTLTVTNAGSVAASLDQLRAVLPPGVTFVPGSATLGGAAYANPVVAGGDLTWSDNYSVAANGSLTLTFQVTVPATGTYQLSGFARIGDTQIDTTLPTTDNAPATATVAADATPPDTTLTATPPPLSASASATFAFTGSDPGGSGVVGFQYRLDGGAWTAATSPLTLSGLSNGPHTFEVRAVDAVGNIDPTPASYGWTIDTVAPGAPAVTGVSPDTGASATDRVTKTGALTVAGTAEPNATVSVFDGGTPIGTATADGSGKWTLVASLTEGLHPLTATATDAAGNTSAASAPTPVRVDLTAPDTAITGRPAVLSGSAAATFTFTGSDPGGSGIAGFEYRLDGGSWAAATSPLTLTGLGDGGHTFDVRATDVAGNTDATPASYSWTIDTTAPGVPAITGITPDTGASPTDRVTNTGTLTVTGTAEPNAVVTVSDNGVLLGPATADAAGAWTLPTTLAEGTHPLTATATDAAGNTSAASAPAGVLVDLTAPSTGIASQPPAVSGSASATFTFTGADAHSGVAGFVYLRDGGPWTAAASPLTLTGLADGAHTFAVRAVDLAGNPDPDSGGSGYTWTVDTGAPAAPAITGITPDTGASASDRVTNTGTLTVTGTAEANATVTVSDNGTVLGTATADAAGNWTLPTSLTEGAHPLTATATDAANNTSGALAPAGVLVDLTAPTTGIASQPPAVSGSASATFTFTGADALSGVAGFQYQLDGGPWTAATSPLTLTGLSDGTHTFAVRAVDLAGNPDPSGAAGYSWTVDTAAPAAPVITGVTPDTGASPTDRVTNTGTLTVTGTAEANSTVTISDNGAFLGTTTANASGNWTLPVTLAEGTHPLTATATDAANNTSAASAPAGVLVDLTGPDTGISSQPPAVSGSGSATFTFTGADALSGVAGFEYRLDGGAWTAAATPLTLTGLTDGSHTFEVRAVDLAGNPDPDTGGSGYTWTVDTGTPAVPTITGISPDTGASPADRITNTGGLTVRGTAEPNVTVTVFDNGTPIGTTAADAAGNWTLPTTLTEATHPLTATATDAGGNTSAASSPAPVVVDLTAPVAAAVTGPTATATTTPTITGTAEPGSTVAVFDGTTLLGTATVDGAGNWSFTPTAPLGEGQHSITAAATDTAGNTGPASPPVVLTVSTTVAVLPAATPDWTVGGPDYPTVFAATGTLAPFTFTVKAGTSLPPGLAIDPATGDVTGSPTAAGDFAFVVVATDPVGNTAERAFTIHVNPAMSSPYGDGLTVLPYEIVQEPAGIDLAVVGGTGAIRYAVTAGALPAGLALDPDTGRLSGTPTVRGSYFFTVTATDGVNAVFSKDYRLDVIEFPLLTSGSAGVPTLGEATGEIGTRVNLYGILDGNVAGTATPFLDFGGEVLVAYGDVTGDRVPEIVATPGLGGGPRVVVMDIETGAERASFFAYDAEFRGGLTVAVGDLTGDGVADFVTGAGPTGAAHVKVFDGRTHAELASFLAFDPAFRGGARVAVADVTGDGTPDIIVGAGPGGAPHVKVFDGRTYAELASWYAFEDRFRGGVYVAGGDLYHTGLDVVVAGAGAEGGPRVSVFETPGGVRKTDFFAYDVGFGGGVRVAVNDADHDGLDDLITGAGPGGGPHVRTWDVADGGATELASFFAFDPTNTLGVSVG